MKSTILIALAVVLGFVLRSAFAEDVYFDDPNLEVVVRDQLGIPEPTPITTNDMLNLTHLYAIQKEIGDLTGIEYATNLTVLELSDNQIHNIAALTGLMTLSFLNLQNNSLDEEAFETHLPQIQHNNPDMKLVYDVHEACEFGASGQDPFKVVTSDGAYYDFFGYSTSINGNYAVVGAMHGDDNGNESGSAYILSRQGTSWVEQTKLTAFDGALGDYFGVSVSISGEYAIVGAYMDDDNGEDAGSAYIFKREGINWTEQAKLTATDGRYQDYFGCSVSISDEYAIIGASGYGDGGSHSGVAYIFKRDGSNWTQQAKLSASDGGGADSFGRSVSISGDYAIVGSYYKNVLGDIYSGAYIFKRIDNDWTEETKLISPGNNVFGESVSISGDYAIVGMHQNEEYGDNSGSAYIFKRDGTNWTQQARLTAPQQGVEDYFGCPVSISGDYAFVSAPRDDDYGSSSGAVYVYKRQVTNWILQAKVTAPDAAVGDLFGSSVSISGDYAVVGAYGNDDKGKESGSAYMLSKLCPIEYQLTVDVVDSHAVAEPNGGSYERARVVRIELSLDSGWWLHAWNGTDNDSSMELVNTVTMSSDKIVTVVLTDVNFVDPNLEAAVRDKLGLQKPARLMSEDMLLLTSLDVSDINIFDLTGLEKALNLTTLDLSGNAIRDISALGELTSLSYLNLEGNPLNDSAFDIYLPNIQYNNPDINLGYDTDQWFQLTVTVFWCEGEVDPNSGIYQRGRVVSVIVYPQAGYLVHNWSNTDDDSSRELTNTVTMNSDKTVEVFLCIDGKCTFNVPSEYVVIQAAIDAARDGDTIVVAPGIYTGDGNRNIDFKGKAITVRSESGPENCIIDCNNLGRGFYFHSDEDANSVLNGFTIIKGYAEGGGGIFCYWSSPTITNCIIAGNRAYGYPGGGGAWIQYGSPVFINCAIIDNSADRDGGGIRNGRGSVQFINCIISGNTAVEDGGGVYNSHTRPTITNCVITGNRAGINGGGIHNWGGYSTITKCTISGNTAGNWGGGIYNTYGSETAIINSILSGNSARIGSEIALNDSRDVPSTAAVSYCDVQGRQTTVHVEADCTMNWGNGNIDADPCFVDPGYWADANDPNIIVEPNDPNVIWVDGDYYLLPDSLCIDAGDPNYIAEPNETDLDGNPRVIGGRIDMGAFEYSPPTIPAEVRIVPRTLNLTSRGKWITSLFWLPEDYDVADIDPNSVVLEGEIEPEWFSVYEQQQIVIVRFSRSEVQGILAPGEVELTVSGELADGTVFEGTDVIRVIDKGKKLNQPPNVTITKPQDGAVFDASETIEIEANAWDVDGSVVKVEFFADGSKIGEDNDGADGWKSSWNNHPAGSYSLTAKATDNDGAATASPAVGITVVETPPPGQASNPNPADGATRVSPYANLSWTAGSDAASHDVYLGTTSPGAFRGNQTATTFDPGTMAYGTTYYWRIDEVNAGGTTTGTVWSFTTFWMR